MSLSLYLPIAGNGVNIILLFGLGGAVGFLSGLFGVGGGFLMTPLLIMAGIPSTVAAASDSNQIVAASTSGSYAHYRLGNVDFKMGLLLLLGGVVGGTLGVQLIKLLRALGNADFVIKITYVLMLGIVGGYMFVESLQALRKKVPEISPSRKAEPGRPSIYTRMVQALPWQMHFDKSGVTVSLLLPVILGTLVGILAAIMGVGGGFIMVPVMVYMLRMPMHVVVGTSLFQILFTCINVTIMQAISNHTVDLVLAIILLLGSTIGAQFGVKLSRRLKADQLKILLASIVLLVMVQILVGLLLPPQIMLGYKGGH
ncbi:MAG: sulfite exporter TauE/SafE family protein [Thermodesulfobacteriota bacterium]